MLIIILGVLVFAGSLVLYGTILLKTGAGNSSGTIPPASADYCFVHEVHPDYLGKSLVVHLTPEDLKGFPLYEKIIRSGKNNTREWINGYRFVSDFTDYEHRFEDFRNLSCRNISYDDCRARGFDMVYEFEAQYYRVGCLPDFSGAHRTRDEIW
jgi:hypothetical protein